jgi:hypothetical protein
MYFVWYDDNPQKPVEAKIDEAVLRYKQRYGRTPDICMLNDATPLPDYTASMLTAGLRVMPARHVPKNYFWVGNEA